MTKTTASKTDFCRAFAASHAMNVLGCVTRVPPGLPPQVVIPDDQLYYWSPEWQNAEHEAPDELRRGLGVEFGDATEAIRSLLTDGG